MIEYLEKLVEEKKYREAIEEAERLMPLAHEEHELLVVHSAMVTCRYWLGDYQGALSSGEVAIEAAERLGKWDQYGYNTLFLGVAHSRLGKFDNAVNLMYAYLAKLHLYTTAREYESLGWYNLGIWLTSGMNEPVEGAQALSKALAAAVRSGNAREAHGIRHALVDAYLKAGVYEPVPRLLAQCGHYLRTHPDLDMGQQSRVFHTKLRAEFALATGRLKRARALALRGLMEVVGQSDYESRFHLLLARLAYERGVPEEGLGHALAAKTCALHGNRPDVEAKVAEMVHMICTAYPSCVDFAVDPYFT